jgi:hypothetical protein
MVQVRPGQSITAGLLQSLTPQAPQTWELYWSTNSGEATPSFGNSAVSTKYTVFGQWCVGRVGIEFGSTTDFGAGASEGDNWKMSAPVTALSGADNVGFGEITKGTNYTSRMPVRVKMLDTGSFSFELSGGRVDGTATTKGGLVDSVTPWTWSSNDTLYFDFSYWIS